MRISHILLEFLIQLLRSGAIFMLPYISQKVSEFLALLQRLLVKAAAAVWSS